MPGLAFLVAFACAIVLASIIEWFVHKEFMHSIRFMRTPHQRHAVQHHSERRSPGRFFAKPDELKEYHLFETSFMPILWLLHTPFFTAIYWCCGPWACLGVAGGTAAYVFSYEVIHWSVHCPDNFPFRGTGWFRFLTEHHRRHHNRWDCNYNVVLPLADWLFGTLTFREIRPEPEQASPS